MPCTSGGLTSSDVLPPRFGPTAVSYSPPDVRYVWYVRPLQTWTFNEKLPSNQGGVCNVGVALHIGSPRGCAPSPLLQTTRHAPVGETWSTVRLLPWLLAMTRSYSLDKARFAMRASSKVKWQRHWRNKVVQRLHICHSPTVRWLWDGM